MAAKHVTLIGVPQYLGVGRRGVDMGAYALRIAGIHEALRALGHEVADAGDIDVETPDVEPPSAPGIRYLDEIRTTCERLRDEVARVLAQGSFPVVLGGDHSIAMGTIAGLSNHHAAQDEKVGVVWFDAHGDANTPETSPTGNVHGMPLAVALGMGPAELVGLGSMQPILDGSRASLVGLREVDRGEHGNLQRGQVGVFSMRDIGARGMRAVMDEAIERALASTVGIHVSIDLDAMDPAVAPGVGTPSPEGLSYRDAHLAMEMLARTGKVISAELVEVDPILDHGNQTAELGVALLASLMGKGRGRPGMDDK